MATAQFGAVIRHIRRLASDPKLNEQSDRALLAAFLSQNDQAAFEALLRRHGPMVLRVCQRSLGNLHDAEDALQATFLVLARQARSIRKKESLASWLHGVAYRMSKNAKRAAVRRRGYESRVRPAQPQDPALSAAWQEFQVLLDEEIGGLPETLREPFVLCCVENKTCSEAARQLRLEEGTVWNRLGRARKLLQQRLTRRGITLSAGILAALLGQNAASAVVPPPLLLSTVQAATLVAAGQAVDVGLVSTKVAALVQGVSKTMFYSKLKIAALLLLAVSVGTTGFGFLKHQILAAQASDQKQVQQPEAVPTTPQAKELKDAFADPLPPGAVARLGTVRFRHGAPVHFFAFPPDGKTLLTASQDQTIRLWDLVTGKELRRFDRGKTAEGPPHRSQYPVALSPDGKVVAAAWDGTLYLWTAATGKLLHEVATGQGALQFGCLAFAADGKAILTADQAQSALVWDVASGKNTKRLGKPKKHGGLVFTVAVSPDWKYLASLWDDNGAFLTNTVKIRDLATDRELPEIKVVAAHSWSPLTFSSDSKTLAWLGRGLEGGVALWDVGAHKERLHLARKGDESLSGLALSADGKSVAVSYNGGFEIWDAETGKQVAQGREPSPSPASMAPSPSPYSALAFSPDAKKLVADFRGTVLQFDATTGQRAAGPGGGHRAPVSQLSVSGHGKAIVTYSRGDPLRCWDLVTGREVGQVAIPENATCAACSADGQRIAAAVDNTVTVYDAAGKKVWRHDGGTVRRGVDTTSVSSLALSPDGRVLAVRESLIPEVQLWDTTTGKHQRTLAQTQGTEAPAGAGLVSGEAWGVMTLDLAFSPDGRYIVGADAKRQLVRWDSRTGEPVWSVALGVGAKQAVERFALSGDGHALATLNSDGTVTVYEAATGQERCRLGKPDENGSTRVSVTFAGLSIPMPSLDQPIALAFSPGGRYLATAKDAPVIRLWDLITGQEAGQLKGHQGGIVSLMFTADGTRLLSGSADTTALVWDLGRALKKAAPPERLDARALDRLWADLTSKDAAQAFVAMRRLAASPAQAAALVKERLQPAAPVDSKTIRALIADLKSDQFAVRQKTEAGLEALGELAEPELRKALGDDPEIDLRQRLERLLRHAAYVGLVREPRAVELLELAGGGDARRVLDELSRGAPGARLTREAKAVAERLAKRP